VQRLAPRDAQDALAVRLEPGLADGVVLRRDLAAVPRGGVALDGEALGGPAQVRVDAPETDVDLRPPQPRAVEQVEHDVLELGARRCRPVGDERGEPLRAVASVCARQDVGDLPDARQLHRLRLAHRSPQRLVGEVVGEVEQRPRGCRARDEDVAADVALVEAARAMDADAGVPPPARAYDGHLRPAAVPGQVAVERTGRISAERRGAPAGEDGREEPAVQRDPDVPDGVDAVVQAVQSTVANPAPDRSFVEPEPEQLARRDDAFVLGGEDREPDLGGCVEKPSLRDG
jgi:hypothetical protein